MNYIIEDYYRAIDNFAPFSSAAEWDNAGLLVGSLKTCVSAALVALDLTNDVLSEAITLGANLIITHHPAIYPSVRLIDGESLLYRAIRENMAVISAHTNYDIAEDGVNDILASLFELQGVRAFESKELSGLGRIGVLKTPLTSDEFAASVKRKLCAGCVKYTQGSLISVVAVGGGSCAELWRDALNSGAQAFVTGEVKHHLFLSASHEGFTLIDAGHFSTEVVAVPYLAKQLSGALPCAEIAVSKVQRDPAFYV